MRLASGRNVVVAVVLASATGSAAGAGELTDPSWTQLGARPTEVDLACASYDYKKQWAVSIKHGVPSVTIQKPLRRQDPLPFPVPPHRDRSGDRLVLQVDGGWLVGFDDGEFGGGLWFTGNGVDWR